MLNSPGTKVAHIGIQFLFCWSIAPGHGRAEAPIRPLVVVTDAVLGDAVRRLGDQLVRVELLGSFPKNTMPVGYEDSNDRARELLEFQLLLFRNTECSRDRFWRERVSAANPTGCTLGLAPPRQPAELERTAERLKAVHRVLASLLPNHRKQLDTNLQGELHRLLRRSVPSWQIAAND